MTYFYHVTDTGEPTEAFTGPYNVNDVVTLEGNDGIVRSWTVIGAVPEWGLYTAVPTEAVCGPPANYYTRIIDLTFTGVEGSSSARIVESLTCEPKSDEDIYAIRLRELGNIYIQVVGQGVTINLSAGSTDMQSVGDILWQYVNTGSSAYPGTTQYASRDLWDRRINITPADCLNPAGIVPTMLSLHYTVCLANRDALEDELDTALEAGDRQTLETLDLSTGWPEAPEPPVNVESFGPQARGEVPETTDNIWLMFLHRLLENPNVNGADASTENVMDFLYENLDVQGDMATFVQRWLDKPFTWRGRNRRRVFLSTNRRGG